MADDISTKNAQDLNNLQQSMNDNLAMASRFYEASVKSTGEQKTALEGISQIYNKLAQQEAQLLETRKAANDIQEDTLKLLDKEKTLKEKMAVGTKKEQEAAQKELKDLEYKKELLRDQAMEKSKMLVKMQSELDLTKKQVQEMSKYKSLLGEAFGTMRAKLVTALVSAEALRRSFETLLKTSRDIADISIMSGSYAGMGEKDGFLNAAKQITNYAVSVSSAQMALARFGYSADEARAAFKDFSQISAKPEDMEAMTKAAGGLSRMLGVDLSEATGFIIDQNLKFNRTAVQTSQTLLGVQQSVEHLNKGFDQSIIKGRDITKVLMDISRESNVLAQDQDAIAKILTSNIVKLQGGGATYREAFESAKKFTDVLTKNSPEFLKIMSGREVLKSLQTDRGATMAELQKTAPEVAKRVQGVLDEMNAGKITKYAAERRINEMTAQTKVGLNASMKAFSQSMGVFEKGAVERIQATMGVTFEQASQMVKETKAELGIKEIPGLIREGVSKGLTDKDIVKNIAKFGLDLDENDITKLKGLSSEMQEAQIRSIQLEKDRAHVKEAQDEREAAHNKDIADKKKQIADFENMIAKEKDVKVKESYKKTVEMLKGELTELQGADLKTLTGIGDALADKYQKLDVGSYWNQLKSIFQNPLVQMATGLAGITLLVANSIMQTGLLTTIAAELGAQGGGNMISGALSMVKGAMPMLITGLVTAATIGLIIAAVYAAYKAVTSMGETEKQQADQNKKAFKGTESHMEGRIAALRKEGQTEKADKLEKILAESRQTQNEINEPTGVVSRTAQLFNPFSAIGHYWNSATSPTQTSPTDTSAINPTGAGPMPPGTVSAGGGGGQVTQRAELAPGAQGTDIMLVTRIPVAAAMAQNNALTNKMKTSPPTGN